MLGFSSACVQYRVHVSSTLGGAVTSPSKSGTDSNIWSFMFHHHRPKMPLGWSSVAGITAFGDWLHCPDWSHLCRQVCPHPVPLTANPKCLRWQREHSHWQLFILSVSVLLHWLSHWTSPVTTFLFWLSIFMKCHVSLSLMDKEPAQLQALLLSRNRTTDAQRAEFGQSDMTAHWPWCTPVIHVVTGAVNF